jgi:mannose-6-phosphate isomerase-like protein (cupin superfamily)
LTAHDFSKYSRITPEKTLTRDAAILRADVRMDRERHSMVTRYMARIVSLIEDSNAVVPVGSTCDLSHHYGLENYERVGLALIDCVNREYCKKLLVLLPGQEHPAHRHKNKEETFIVLHGDLTVRRGDDDDARTLYRGETMTVERDAVHSFSSVQGCVFEEISSTHFNDDSYYEKQEEFVSPRKTTVFMTQSVLRK